MRELEVVEMYCFRWEEIGSGVVGVVTAVVLLRSQRGRRLVKVDVQDLCWVSVMLGAFSFITGFSDPVSEDIVLDLSSDERSIFLEDDCNANFVQVARRERRSLSSGKWLPRL